MWKVVGNRNGDVTNNASEMGVGESSKTRREVILKSIRLRKERSSKKVSDVWYVSMDGKIFEACVEEYREEPSKGMLAEEVQIQASVGIMSEEELEDPVLVKATLNKRLPN